ncbi:MAG: hypothetical protein HC800_25610 [Phormidesmis sp. RL_2_1]|nr:hypothetical protein [Phormidesmis sp. RL_2_1]
MIPVKHFSALCPGANLSNNIPDAVVTIPEWAAAMGRGAANLGKQPDEAGAKGKTGAVRFDRNYYGVYESFVDGGSVWVEVCGGDLG